MLGFFGWGEGCRGIYPVPGIMINVPCHETELAKGYGRQNGWWKIERTIVVFLSLLFAFTSVFGKKNFIHLVFFGLFVIISLVC